MTVLHTSLTFGACCQPTSVRGDAFIDTENVTRQNRQQQPLTAYATCIFQNRDLLCFLSPCAFTKEKPQNLVLTKYCVYITEQAIQITYCAILSPIPSPTPENLPQPADSSRQQTRKVCLHFPVRHASVHVIEK